MIESLKLYSLKEISQEVVIEKLTQLGYLRTEEVNFEIFLGKEIH